MLSFSVPKSLMSSSSSALAGSGPTFRARSGPFVSGHPRIASCLVARGSGGLHGQTGEGRRDSCVTWAGHMPGEQRGAPVAGL